MRPAQKLIAATFSMLAIFSGASASAGATKDSFGFPFSPKIAGDNWQAAAIGRVQQDFIWADANVADFNISDSELRRLRAGFQGKYGSTFNFKFEVEFDISGGATVTDAYLAWRSEAARIGVMAGQFKTPNSLDNLTSSRFTSTLERAGFVTAFGFDRRVGASVISYGKNHTLTAGVFGETFEQNPFGGSFAVAARATYNPVKTDDRLIHLGASFRYRHQGDEAGLITYSQRSYEHKPGKIIGTPDIADSDFFAGAEFAATYKNFWTAGEYGRLGANCAMCATDPGFNGYYIEAGVFIGGRRGYKKGKFGRPIIDRTILQGGVGAISFVARFDSVNLADDAIDGGALDTIIIGAEWWSIAHAKISLNYFNADADLGDTISGLDPAFATIVTAGAAGDGVEGVTLRLQLDL